MYCKECGHMLESDSAAVCLNCGVKRQNGNNYCEGCGEPKKSPIQDICLRCGMDFRKGSLGSTNKTKLVALLLWFFIGGFGAHQFYAGNNGKGILYLVLTLAGFLTCGITSLVSAILCIIDLVKILTDKFTDNNGNVITEWT